MNRTQSNLLFLGGILMVLAILFGVFGAHLIKDHLDDVNYENFRTANRYHRFHAVSILLLIPLCRWLEPRHTRAVAWLFSMGILLFSGSMYLYTTSELLFGNKQEWMAAVIPFGGVAFISGWGYLTYLGWRQTRPLEEKDK